MDTRAAILKNVVVTVPSPLVFASALHYKSGCRYIATGDGTTRLLSLLSKNEIKDH
jgi:hypothetical protein